MTKDAEPSNISFSQIDLGSFLELKKHQHLLVDFHELPDRLSSLFDFCLQHSEEQNPRFLCSFEDESLCLFEYNEFRHLLHLQLSMEPMKDDDAKGFLAKKLLLERELKA